VVGFVSSTATNALPMHAYVIAALQVVSPGRWGPSSPGCKLQRWRPLGVKAKGKLADAINTFEQLADVGLSPITYKVPTWLRRSEGLETTGAGTWLAARIGSMRLPTTGMS